MPSPRLSAVIGAQDKTQAAFKSAQKNAQKFQKQIKGFQATFKDIAVKLGVSGVATAIGTIGVKFNIMRENAQVAFTQLLGSGEKATTMLDQLQEFAKKTPFTFSDLTRASQRMLAFGFAAEEVMPLITNVSDAVASMGGSSEMVDRVTTALGQMRAKGKVSAEEMMQLTEAGIPAWQMLAENIDQISPSLAKAFAAGKITQEGLVAKLMKLAEQGKIKSGPAISALMSGIQSRFGGMAAKGATTTSGIFSNLTEALDELAGALTKPGFREAAGIMKTMTDWLTKIGEGFKGLPPGLQDVIGLLATAALGFGALVAPLGLLGFGLQGLGPLWTKLKGAITGVASVLPWIAGLLGLPVLAVVAIIAGLALLYLAWTNNWLGIRDITASVLAWLGQAIGDAWTWIVGSFNWLTGEAGRIIGEGWTTISGWFTWLWGEATRIVGDLAGWVANTFRWLGDEAVRTIRGAWQSMAGWFGWLIREATGIVAGGWQNIRDWFQWLGDTAGGIISGAWTRIRDTFGWLIGEVTGIVAGGLENLVAWWEWLSTRVSDIVGGIRDAVTGAFDSIVGKVNDLLQPIRAAIEEIKRLFGGLSFEGVRSTLYSWGIPGFAAGGIVTGPTLAMVGEAGPEAIVPLGYAGMGGGGGSITVNISGPVYGIEDLEDVIVAAIERAQRRGRQ